MKHAVAASIALLAVLACAEPVTTPAESTSPLSRVATVSGDAPAGSIGFSSAALRAPAARPALDIVAFAGSGGEAILPNAMAGVMGIFNNTLGHAWPNMRYQQLFLGSELGTLRRIGALCLRRDEFFGGPEIVQQLTVKLAPTTRTLATMSATFDDNYAAAPTTVFSGDVTIPFSAGGGTPDDFYFCITFTTAYNHPAGSNLIVETINTSASSPLHFEDFCDGRLEPGCTTRRMYAFSAAAAVGDDEGFNAGLIMKFIGSSDPTTKGDCMNGGWADFGFANQGLCIRFVETGKDSR